MRMQFLLMRFAMFAAIASVIGLVTWLLLQDVNRETKSQTPMESQKPSTFTSTDESVEQGSANDILVRLNQLPLAPESATYITRATRLQDKILLYRELIKRESELPQSTSNIVRRGMLGCLLQMHTINLFEQVRDTNVRDELTTIATEMVRDSQGEPYKDAQVALTAIPILEYLATQSGEKNIETVQTSITTLFQKFPSDKVVAESMYAILTNLGIRKENEQNAIALLKLVNEQCVQSGNAEVQEMGKTYSGRLLLIENEILNLDGRVNLFQGDDEKLLVTKIEKMIAVNGAPSASVANAIILIAQRMEYLNKNESALKVYHHLNQQSLPQPQSQNEIAEGIKRLETVGKNAVLPDLIANENNVVLFVSDTENSKQAILTISNLLVLRPGRKLNLILVTFDDDPAPTKTFLQTNQLKDIILVSDPQKESAYYKFFPARFFPSVIVIDSNSMTLDVNVNLKQLQEILLELSENN